MTKSFLFSASIALLAAGAVSAEEIVLAPEVPEAAGSQIAPTETIALGDVAQSLCGMTDEAQVLQLLAGAWALNQNTSLDNETIAVTKDNILGTAMITAEGNYSSDLYQAMVGEGAQIALTLGAPIYDVDQVDDMLETTEAEWMADALSLTPCGPEALPQLHGRVDYAPDVTGQVTVIGYFADQLLMISELELRGDWGIGFLTDTAILVPQAEATSAQ